MAAAGRTALQVAPRLGTAGSLGALAAAAVMAARRRQRERAPSSAPVHEGLDVEEVRWQLLEKIREMSDEDLLALVAQVESPGTEDTPEQSG